MRAPRARTWGRRGHTPMIGYRGGKGRVNIAGLCCYRPGHRPRLIYRLLIYRDRKGEPKGFDHDHFQDLLKVAHRQLGAPIELIWDNLSAHKTALDARFLAAHSDWLRVHYLPVGAPELNPTENVWSTLKTGPLANLAPTSLDHLASVIKTGLKKLQYRPDLLRAFLAGTGLALDDP